MIDVQTVIKHKDTGQMILDVDAETLDEATLNGRDLRRVDLRGAYLRGRDLKGADLHGVDLEGADLEGADLEGANLEEANLRGAELEGARLVNAVLKRTTLWDANLRNADLTGAKDLLPEYLAGADLSGATLPQTVLQADGVTHANELSRNAGKLLVALLTACAYALITIFGTKDVQLLKLSGAAKLPIIDTEVPLFWFYLLAPTCLLGLYIYFHLYLHRLWEELASLPAVFADGRPLDKRIDPWLLNGLARNYFRQLRDQPQRLAFLQTSLSTVVAWYVLPITLFFFFARYSGRLLWLPEKADWGWAALQVVLLTLTVWISLTLHRLGVATLCRETSGLSRPKRLFRQWETYARGALALAVVSAACSLCVIGRSRFAANLQGADLRGAHLDGARLPRARLDEARLEGTHLQKARLSHAHLGEARLEGAHLEEAALRESHLEGAHLREATLSKAALRGADLTGAECQKAHFDNSDLSGAVLKGTDLTGADLSGTALAAAELNQAVLTGANLFTADLHGAVLQGANLRGANLQYADLRGAELDGALLQGVDLSTAKGLREQQLRTALLDAKTRLPGNLRAPRQGSSSTLAALSGSDLLQPDPRVNR